MKKAYTHKKGGITIKRKSLAIILGIALLVTSVFTINIYNHKKTLEQKISVSKEIIKWNFSYVPLLFLFEQVINNPSEGNLSALYEELRNKEGQLQAYLVLSLTEDQLAQKFRKGSKLTIEDYHLISNNLTHFDKNNTENITKIKQLKEAWQIFIQDSGGRPHSWEAIMVANAFIKLVDLSEKYLYGLEEKKLIIQ